ncbi:MAG: hypothetical protein KQH79_01065 [Bacteroidetes bacterium]|nr:hypothetical protein [Bacteroidota bacterium]
MKKNLINIPEEAILNQLKDIQKNPQEFLNKIEGLEDAEIDCKILEQYDLMVIWYIDPNMVSLKLESAAIFLAIYNIFHAIHFFVNEEKKMSQLYSTMYLKLKEISNNNYWKIFPVITEKYTNAHKSINGI